MTGDQFALIDKPYMKMYQQRTADQNTSKMVKPKPVKVKRKKGKVAKRTT